MNKESLRSIVKKEWRIPYSGKMMRVIKAFSLTEKTIFFLFVALLVGSSISLLYQANKLFLVEVPDYGGTLVEGVIGSPRFINPILSSSDIDKDLTTLVYSGLLKVNSSGELIPDLAESFTISDDTLTYTFRLKDNIYFHDGVKLTVDDVIFTIEKAQDSNLKSPREVNWSGVNIQKIDDKTVSFKLNQPYSPFIQNATMGILPKHIWNTASIEEFPFSQFNIKPIGSGPYKVDSIAYSGSGLPLEYHLKSFSKYVLGKPYITNLVIKAFKNENDVTQSFKNGDIEGLYGISPKQLPNLEIQDDNVILSPLPRVFGVFFNQNIAPVFVYKEVRQALDIATDKQVIIDMVINGFGQVINGPVPPNTVNPRLATSTDKDRIEKAQEILTLKGWQLNDKGVFEKKDKKNTVTLSFSISTGNIPELKETAYLLQKQWQDFGAEVEVKIFEIGDLNQNVIRTRKYDALLFGEIIGRDLDLYPFWHSSARVAPGLNIALYTNIKVDKTLENIRKTSDIESQKTYLNSFNKEIKNDAPAVFTYSPYFIYIIPKRVNNVVLGTLANPSERFSDVHKWFIETNKVWKIFTK